MSQGKKEMTDQKPREFWIAKNYYEGTSVWNSESAAKHIKAPDGDLLHVIEKSAYTAKCAEVEELVEVLKMCSSYFNHDFDGCGPPPHSWDECTFSADEALSKHQQGEGSPKGGSGE